MRFVSAWVIFGLGALICVVNFHLSVLRYAWHRLCGLPRETYRHVSGFPVAGSLLVGLSLFVLHGVPALWVIATTLIAMDAGGIHWFAGTMICKHWGKTGSGWISVLKAVTVVCIAFPLFAAAGVLFCGAGHGSALFYGALLSPISHIPPSWGFVDDWAGFALGFLFWASVAVAWAFRRQTSGRYALPLLLIVHEVGVIVLCVREGVDGVEKVWNAVPGILLLFLGGYLAFQIMMWISVFRNSRPRIGCDR